MRERAEQEEPWLFVVFDGGDRSLAEIQLKRGAAYTEMRSALATVLGEEVNKKMYALRYVDPSKEGKTSRNEKEWVACWAVSLAEKGRMLEVDMMKIPLVKPYRLSLKVGATKGDKKKMYYPIVYDEPVTFNVSVEGETLSIKEKTLNVPKHDKGAIMLHFVPMDAPKEETILVKLEEQSTGIQHTVKINATWS